MTARLDRRSFLLTGSLGLGAFAVPGFAQTPNVTHAQGFLGIVGDDNRSDAGIAQHL